MFTKESKKADGREGKEKKGQEGEEDQIEDKIFGTEN